MKQSLKIFLCLGIACALVTPERLSAMPPLSILMSSIKAVCKQHPIATSLACLAGVYGASYGLTQLASKNKKIEVSVVDSGVQKITQEQPKSNYLFAHGIAETHEQAYWYTKGKSTLPHIIDGRLFTYDYPDATKHFWRVNFTQTGLGQHNEIMAFKSAYEQTIKTIDKENSSENLIVTGVSRGATTILNYVGLYNPTRVKAIIAETPFDTTLSLVKNMLRRCYLDKVPGMQTIAHYIMSGIFWQHSTTGTRAIDSVTTIDKNLPILLIGSQEDTLVPLASTMALYNKLRETGHDKVHIFVAKQGKHARILHSPEGKNYQRIVHAFYRKYGLPHDESLAAQGTSLLEQSQPST